MSNMKYFDLFTNLAIGLCLLLFVLITVAAFVVVNSDKDIKMKLVSPPLITAICDLNVTEPNSDEITINCKLK